MLQQGEWQTMSIQPPILSKVTHLDSLAVQIHPHQGLLLAGVPMASSADHPFRIRRVMILSLTFARASLLQALAVLVSYQAVILFTWVGALYVLLKC